MANPISGDLRGPVSSALRVIYQDLIMVYTTIDETSWSSENHDTITANIDSARDLVYAALVANQSDST